MKHLAILFSVGGLAYFSIPAFWDAPEAKQDQSAVLLHNHNNAEITNVIRLVEAFKATLTEEQRVAVQLPYSKTEAAKWSNLPVPFTRFKRPGISLGALTPAQLKAAQALLKTAAGSGKNEGWDELQQLLNADEYLAEKQKGNTFGAGNYYIASLGTPATTGTFEIQFGGHHLAFGNIYKNGRLVSGTPSFRGVEPFGTFTWENRKNQPLNQELDALAKMLSSLTEKELAAAKLSATFSDLLLGAQKDGAFPNTASGLKCNTLSPSQKKLVLNAIKTYVYDVDDKNAAMLMAKYTKELNDTYIAFSGTPQLTTRNDYVRIDGPSLWIEYSCQNGVVLPGTHPHSVWRDKLNDYGGAE